MGIDESLQRLVERLVKTWNDRDWASFSQLFADNAHYVTGAGVCLPGRQRIHDNFVTRVPAPAEAERVSLVMQSIHLLGTDAAVLLCSWRMGFGNSGEGRESIVRDGVATIVVERAGESWRIIALQNTDKTADRAHELTSLRKPPLRANGMAVTNRLRTEGTANLLAVADRLGAKRMVTQSIIFGYGYRDHGDRILTERDTFGVPAGDLTDDAVAALASAETQTFKAPEGIALRYGLLYGGDGAQMRTMLQKRGSNLPRIRAEKLRAGM